MKASKLFTLSLSLLLSLKLSLAYGQQTTFENILYSNESIKKIMDGMNQKKPTSPNPIGETRSDSLNDIITRFEDFSKDESNRPQHVQTQYFDDRACLNCPQHRTLSRDVQSILEKIDTSKDSIDLANDARTEANNLKFLYYMTKDTEFDGHVRCATYGNVLNIKQERKGSMDLITTEVVNLPNFESAQFIPNNRELIYIYKGDKNLKNKFVVMHVRPDKTVEVKYYQYNPTQEEVADQHSKQMANSIGDLVARMKKENTPTTAEYAIFKPSIKFSEGLKPTDLELAKTQTQITLNSSHGGNIRSNLSVNQQELGLSLSRSNENYLVINAKNVTNGNKELVTILPAKMTLDEKYELNVSGSVSNEVVADRALDSTTNAQRYKLNLTDKNLKYLEFEVYARPKDDYQKLSLRNESDLPIVGKITTHYGQDNKGDKSFSLEKITQIGPRGELKTEFGAANNAHYVALSHQQRIGRSTTFSVTAKTSSDRTYTTYFQLESKF